MKLAIAQLNPIVGDIHNNAQQILLTAQQAASDNVRLLLTPELSLCGYPPRDLLLHPQFIDLMQTQLEQLATQLPKGIAVLVGLVIPNPQAGVTGEKPLFNSVALLEEGQIKAIFHKRLLPTYDVFDEDRYFASGTQVNCFSLDTEQGESLSIGVTICEDLWNDQQFWGQRAYPVDPVAEVVATGVDFVVNLSASPFSVGKQQLRETMIQHVVRKHGCPIVYANQIGGNDDLIFDGCSIAVNRQGEIVARAKAFSSDLIVIHWDSPTQDLWPARLEKLATEPEAELWSALVLGVKDYARKCGFKKAVIGLSGGIDSALVLAIATAALGAEQVLGVLMPSPYSSDHSVDDALALAQNLGVITETLRIGTLMQSYDETFAGLFAGTASGITEENLQSRIRGNLLMAISNKFGHLLLSTGNKSEMAVGYCTLYGDMNGGLAVIADVPKTRVYAICHWLNRMAKLAQTHESDLAHLGLMPTPISHEIIPEHILIKAPSAELKPGQVDQDSLPPYEILDDILERLIQHHQSATEIVEAGHEVDTVKRVISLITKTEFKRRQAPPVLKVTDRAFGMGWRMPIASRWSWT
jgi:NAD+ synthase (glutamine-hydrolysing)